MRNKTPKRIYVLDTNVLIHDPYAVSKFDEHEVCLSMTVLEELDQLKVGQSEAARSARQATRRISEILEASPTVGLEVGIPIRPDKTECPGTLRLLAAGVPDLSDARGHPIDLSVPDNRILTAALVAGQRKPERPVVLVSKDVNMRVKGAALGIAVEDYRNDAVIQDADALSEGALRVDDEIWQGFEQYEYLSATDKTLPRYKVKGELVDQLHPGMLVHDRETEELIVRDVDPQARVAELEACLSFRNGRKVWGVNARDARQNFAFNLLLDPQIDLVTLAGPAGTGKTYLAMAAALSLVFDERAYERIVITRETVSMGEDIGFLPGTEEEKLGPWLRGFYDAIHELTGTSGEGDEPLGKTLIESRLQIRSLGLMRGRTFHDTLLILDESQNLTPRQVKNLLSRCGRNTKVLCMGNVAQIDTPYLTPSTCGLAHMVQRFRHWPHAGHVTLTKVERSRLAMEAESVL